MFVAGLLLGVLGMGVLMGDPPASDKRSATVATLAQVSASAPQPQADCASLQPVVPLSGDGDGQASLQKPVAVAPTPADVAALLVTGKEAAASGRARDAEVTFLVACRTAQGIQGGDGVPLADAMYQLGRHYAQVAAAPLTAKPGELLQRAGRLYAASLVTFRAHFGDDSDRTRFAAAGLAAVEQGQVGAGPEVAARQAPAPTVQAAAPKPEPKPQPVAQEEPKPEPVAKAEPKPAPEPKPEPVAKSEPKPAPEPIAKEDPKPEPVAQAKPKPEETVAKAQPKPKHKARPAPPPPEVEEAAPVARAEPAPRAEPAAEAPTVVEMSGPPAAASGDPHASTP